MGERESSIVVADGNDFEDRENGGELEYDDRYEIAKTLTEDRGLEKIENEFLNWKIDRDTYLEGVNAIKDHWLSKESEDSPLREVIEIIFSSILVVQSECLRLKEDSDRSEENLSLRDTKWQIDLANYYWKFKNDATTLPMINLCLKRLDMTHRIVGFDQSYTDGCIRGFKGLLATMNACDALGYQIQLPAYKQDAEGKVDLMVKDPVLNKGFACQIKTVGDELAEPDIVHAEIIARQSDKYKDRRDARILIASAKKLSQNKGKLTYEPVWITIPELEIKDNFEPEKPVVNTIALYTGAEGHTHEKAN